MALQDQSAVPSTWKSINGCKRSFKGFVTNRNTARGAGKGAGKSGQTTAKRTSNCIATPTSPNRNEKNDASDRSNNSVKWALSKPKVLIVSLLAILYILSLDGLFPPKNFHHSRSLVERVTAPFVYTSQVETVPPITNPCIPMVIDAFRNISDKKSGNGKKSKGPNEATNEKNSKKGFKWKWAAIAKECVKAARQSELKKDPNEPHVLPVSHDSHSPVGMNYTHDLCSPHDAHASLGSPDPSNSHHPHDPVNPQGPHNGVNPQDPHNIVNPQDPHNIVNPQDPHNIVNPQDPHNTVNPQDPYDPQNPHDPYDPRDLHDPFDPYDSDDLHGLYDLDDPHDAHYSKDPEKQYDIYGRKKKSNTIIDFTPSKTLTPEENIEFFFYSTSTYVYYTEEMKKRIFANGPVMTKKYMAEIFFDLCDEQKENFLFMKETMSKISFMLASQFKMPNEERSKCWTHLNNKLNKVMDEFDLRDRADFNHFLMQKKRHSAEDFERFVENRICLWNKITRENRYESFLELYKNLNKDSSRSRFPYNDKNYRFLQPNDCYTASNPDMPHDTVNASSGVITHESLRTSTPATPQNTLNDRNSLQFSNVGSRPNPNGAFRSSSPTGQCSDMGTHTTPMSNSNICTTNPAMPQSNINAINRPIPCNTLNTNSAPMANNTITGSNAPAPCSTPIPSIPVMTQSPYNNLNANVTTALQPNTLNANPATVPPYTMNAPVTGVPYNTLNPTVAAIPQGTLNPNVATIPQGTLNPNVATIPQGTLNPTVAAIPQGTYNPIIATIPQGTYNPTVAAIPQGTYNPTVATIPQGTYSPVIATIPQGTYNPVIATIPQGTYIPVTKQVPLSMENGKEPPRRKKKKK
ncbi:Plasmodium exported protein, unknown function [Plasmodium knowlesi strain H]|uniref:Plasmodium RESA N-terminal domain-containing protein n=3 Tax=Plasmodium knowlesi TaxID=5850 RepID=A0A5K1V1P9_PLAKH|nr:Plasmodium exported protein (PHIST), unknown function [Plasmodium knowlesi strain H]OTN66379.1 Uncharacterized protein PKNOH_S09510600 [Plasmodium knowlesi]CAA9986278.1 Plasmodium exported protein (PHIST), unknown function [Plasmodium knowlesi strain H]SBO25495.1 Plasmodium exported protein, unknown function [Plasmodium knowlesi strain H]SBO28266.1 Plasmodium exported protein, unknown function [Plasmodium knowlesi strain H]VVS75752.1 Plasmodium exported protein (PHIST), unknown function [Pl|eukprot:XP_002257686.1 hypothetical protein, conserved in Plasmodium species [Plasmodium knowlesi strain H]